MNTEIIRWKEAVKESVEIHNNATKKCSDLRLSDQQRSPILQFSILQVIADRLGLIAAQNDVLIKLQEPKVNYTGPK